MPAQLPIHRPLSLIELDPDASAHLALPDRIYRTLKRRVLTCSMLPGSRIMLESLSAELNMSPTPLREALNRLVLEGLVVVAPYKGYATAPLTVGGFRELCEVRRILESESAALAAGRAGASEVARLKSLAPLKYKREDRRTYERYLRANSAFHQALVKCTRNGRLEAMVMSALDQHQRPLYLGLGVGVDGKASTEEHLEVVEAVASHNPRRARKVVVEHIASAEERIAGALEAAGY